MEHNLETQDYQRLRTSLDAVDIILQNINRLDKVNNEKDLDQVLPGLLKSIGEYTSSDRAYVFEWTSVVQDAFYMTHEWCAPGVRPTLGEMQNVRTDCMPHWMPLFQKGEPVISYDWDHDGLEAPEEFTLFDGQDIHALIVLPIFSNNKVNGYIGLDNPGHKTSEISVRLLSSVGGHLGSLKENLYMLAKLENKQRSLQELIRKQVKQKQALEKTLEIANLNNEIINSISKIYWMIYRIDLSADWYEEISAGQDVHRLTGKSGIASEVLTELRETIVVEEHQQLMTEFLDLTTLAQRMKDTESIGLEYHAADGSWHLARFIEKKRDDTGKLTNVLYVVREINRQKQRELEYRQKLLETSEEAKKANMAKTDFLRRMSHDIRTPINGIRGIVSIADHYPEDINKQKECRQKVMEASGFLLELVNSVLDMNKLESGKIELEKKPFDLRSVLREICDLVEMQGQEHNIPVYVDSLHIEHPYLLGSPLHLKQVLLNIAGNAVKYNRKGGHVTMTCDELTADNTQAVFRLTCSDTGRGMSEEFKTKAFEPFAQEEFGARTQYMGTGLGLPIAKQLVEMMGGTIDFESELGAGTTFTLEISFELDTDFSKKTPDGHPIPLSSLNGTRVLLVEDNELNMEIARFILQKHNMNVTMAQNGRKAVEIFEQTAQDSFDIILMDIMMPVMNGLEAARAIRSLNRQDAADIPIFAMTANAFPEDIRLSIDAGMNEHISKPLDEGELIYMIHKYLS